MIDFKVWQLASCWKYTSFLIFGMYLHRVYIDFLFEFTFPLHKMATLFFSYCLFPPSVFYFSQYIFFVKSWMRKSSHILLRTRKRFSLTIRYYSFAFETRNAIFIFRLPSEKGRRWSWYREKGRFCRLSCWIGSQLQLSLFWWKVLW